MKIHHKYSDHSAKGQRGAALVEFALVLPILLVILMGIIEFGIILFDKAVITNASREASRERIVYDAPAESTIKGKIIASYGGLPISFGSDNLTGEDITFTSATDATGTYWTASVSFTYDFLYLPISSLNLTSATTMRQE